MILATHAIVGAAAGRIFSNPLAAFAAGFISHFIIDAIPHKDYKLNSFEAGVNQLEDDMVLDRRFIGDSIKVIIDLLIGAAVIFFIFRDTGISTDNLISLLSGAIGGVLPDFLEFASFKIRREPLISLRKFHLLIHSKKRPVFVLGILPQLIVIVVVAAVIKIVY